MKLGGGRLDYQLSPGVRLMGKVIRRAEVSAIRRRRHEPPGGNRIAGRRESRNTSGQITQVISNRAVNEIKGGFTKYFFDQVNLTTWSNHWHAASRSDSHPEGVRTGSPRITFTGFTIAGNQFYPQDGVQTIWSIRDDFTFSYEAGVVTISRRAASTAAVPRLRSQLPPVHGRHRRAQRARCRANIEAACSRTRWNADTWNLAAISPLVRTYDVGVGDFFTDDSRPQIRHVAAGRLAGVTGTDAESWRALRPERECQRQGIQRAAVRRSRKARRHEQRGAAGRFRLPA